MIVISSGHGHVIGGQVGQGVETFGAVDDVTTTVLPDVLWLASVLGWLLDWLVPGGVVLGLDEGGSLGPEVEALLDMVLVRDVCLAELYTVLENLGVVRTVVDGHAISSSQSGQSTVPSHQFGSGTHKPELGQILSSSSHVSHSHWQPLSLLGGIGRPLGQSIMHSGIGSQCISPNKHTQS